MPLKDAELLPRVSKSHRERISKGRRKGLVVRREVSDAAIDAHVALHINSMDRRKSRGEDVPLEFERAGSAALLASGAGELFQAMLGDHVASSLLILRSSTGAVLRILRKFEGGDGDRRLTFSALRERERVAGGGRGDFLSGRRSSRGRGPSQLQGRLWHHSD